MMDLFNAAPIARSDHDPNRPGPIKPKWFYTEEELQRSPTVLSGISFSEEQRLIQHGCTMIRMIAERLNEFQRDTVKISQLCICVSMIQLKRFFVVHSLKQFDARDVGAAALFMSSKSEECPHRLEYVIRAWYKVRCEFDSTARLGPDAKNRPAGEEPAVINKETYEKLAEYIVWLENIILQTIGFTFGIEIPHPFVLKLASQFRKDDKKFSEVVFWLTTDALHLTNWALRYKAVTIGCICFYIASVWKNDKPTWPPADPNTGEAWYTKLDESLTLEFMEERTKEFLMIWRDINKDVHLSMSQFDHRTQPVIMNKFASLLPWQL